MSADPRTPADYAIEHGGYLATAATHFLDILNEQAAFEDVSEAVDMDAIRDSWQALRSAIYEFEKRARRAAA